MALLHTRLTYRADKNNEHVVNGNNWGGTSPRLRLARPTFGLAYARAKRNSINAALLVSGHQVDTLPICILLCAEMKASLG